MIPEQTTKQLRAENEKWKMLASTELAAHQQTKARLAEAERLLAEHSCSCGCVYNPNGNTCTARAFLAAGEKK